MDIPNSDLEGFRNELSKIGVPRDEQEKIVIDLSRAVSAEFLTQLLNAIPEEERQAASAINSEQDAAAFLEHCQVDGAKLWEEAIRRTMSDFKEKLSA